jgi:hypothetical protein
LYLYRTNALPVQNYRVIANRQAIGSLGREGLIIIHSESDEVLLYIDKAIANTVVNTYSVYRVFVSDGEPTVAEIDGNDFRRVESAERIRELQALSASAEVTVP